MGPRGEAEDAVRGAITRVRVSAWWRFRRWLPDPPRLRFHVRMGRESGFPTCCIAWFCAFAWMPDRVHDGRGLWNLLRVPTGRGYVPCPRHYRQSAPHEAASGGHHS